MDIPFRPVRVLPFRALTPVLATLLLGACSSDPPQSIFADITPPPAAPPPALQSGVFRDGPVEGLSFVSGEQSGTTGPDGGFTCETGELITFSIGAVIVGQAECATLVMPPSLVASGDTDDPVAVNIARFLQMLDVDGDLSNGIFVSGAVRQIAEGWPPVDFAAADLDAELVTIISDAASVDGSLHALPSAADASAHLDRILMCSYAGAFTGRFTGDSSGIIALTIGWNTPLSENSFAPEFAAGDVHWMAFNSIDQTIFGGNAFDAVAYSSRPTLSDLAGNELVGRFESPDRITGEWARPDLNRRGTLELERLGSLGGQTRFVGRFFSFRREGMLILDLDGSQVTGAAIDVLSSQLFTITGTVDEEQMTLIPFDGANERSAQGTILFDENLEPRGVSGTWLNDGLFQAAACALN